MKKELPSPELPNVMELQSEPTQLPRPPLPLAPAAVSPSAAAAPVCITFPGRSELSVTPVSKVVVTSSSTARQPKTALDVINDTIIQSLSSNTATNVGENLGQTTAAAPCAPLNLVKIVPTSSSSPSVQLQTPSPPVTPAKQIILVTTPPVISGAKAGFRPIAKEDSRNLDLAGNSNRVVVKCEPEIQIVKCEPPPQAKFNGDEASAADTTEDGGGVDPTLPCVAAAHNGYAARCAGELVNLNKLSSYLDLISRNVARDNGRAAMERAIIKSRLRVPFWQADEVSTQSVNHNSRNVKPMHMFERNCTIYLHVNYFTKRIKRHILIFKFPNNLTFTFQVPTFICERHRYDIVHSSIMQSCAMCNKKRSRKASSPQSIMMTITYR